VKIQTTRFGELQVNRKDILQFVEGPFGFEQLTRFFIVDPGDDTLILWLQSTTDASIAFPIIEPKIFKPDYTARLLPGELASIELENLSDALIYCILTIIPNQISSMSANLKAPIVINTKTNKCRQIVLQDNKLPIKYEMYKELKQRFVHLVSDDAMRTKVNLPSSSDQGIADSTDPLSSASNKSELKKPFVKSTSLDH
jgi:flagellar assembly factor FliW